jgi:hypothetical protein
MTGERFCSCRPGCEGFIAPAGCTPRWSTAPGFATAGAGGSGPCGSGELDGLTGTAGCWPSVPARFGGFTAPGGWGAVVGPVLVVAAFGAACGGGAGAAVAPPFTGAVLAAAGWAGGAGLGAPLPVGDAFGASWCGAGAGAGDEPPLPEADALGTSWWGAGAGADEPPPDDDEPDDSWCTGDGAGELPPPDPPPGPPATPAAGLRFHVNGRAAGAGDTSATSRMGAEPPSARTGDTAPTAAGDSPGPATTNAAPVPSATASRGTPDDSADDSAADSGARDKNVTSKAARTRRRVEPSNTTHPHGGTSRNQIRGEDRSSNVMPSPSAAGDQHPTTPGENTGTTGRTDAGHRQTETGGNCPPETLPGALRRPDPTTRRGTNRTGKPEQRALGQLRARHSLIIGERGSRLTTNPPATGQNGESGFPVRTKQRGHTRSRVRTGKPMHPP